MAISQVCDIFGSRTKNYFKLHTHFHIWDAMNIFIFIIYIRKLRAHSFLIMAINQACGTSKSRTEVMFLDCNMQGFLKLPFPYCLSIP